MLNGMQSGGTAFSRGHLYRILSNPIYIGRIPHRGRSYEGAHDAIIDAETWDKVEAQLATNAGRKRGRTSSKYISLLAGLLFTAEGIPFTPSHAVNHGRRYRYYVERSLLTTDAAKEKSTMHHTDGNGLQSKGWRLPAHETEQFVSNQLTGFLRDRGALLDTFQFKRRSPDLISAVLARASKLAAACESGSLANQVEIVAALVRRVTLAQEQVTVEIDRKALAECLLDREPASQLKGEDRRPIEIKVPVSFRRRGVEAKLVIQNQRQSRIEPNLSLVRALARAHQWFGSIVRGEAIGDIARVERLDRSYVTRVICLAFLAPEITNAILEGQQPTELTAKWLIRSALHLPLLWTDQVDTIQG
jgi:hypothetical protein